MSFASVVVGVSVWSVLQFCLPQNDSRTRRSSCVCVRRQQQQQPQLSTLLLHGRWRFGETLDLKAIGGAQERRQLLLRDVHLAGVHEFEDGLQVAVRDVLQDDDGMLGGVLLRTNWVYKKRTNSLSARPHIFAVENTHLEQRLEVRTAGGEHHFVRLARLALARERDICEALLVAQMPERHHHVRLVVVPFQEELLIGHIGAVY